MKSPITTGLVIACFTLAIAFNVHAQQTFALKSAKATIQGTSSLHDWESEMTKVEFKGELVKEANLITNIPAAEVKVLVEGIKSTKGKIMDNKTKEAFKYEKNPYVTFVLTNAVVKADGSVDATGNLSMAGTTKSVKLAAKTKVLTTGDVQLSLTYKLKMTDYKMEQPTAMMGTITVGDQVTVNFDLVLAATSQHAKK